MNILIAGAGAVGGYYGAMLHKAGHKVSYLVTPRSFDVIHENGLTVKSKGEVWKFHPDVSINPETLTPCDLIIIAVKRNDTDKLLNTLKPIVNKRTVILPLQNGIDSEEEILRYLPGSRVLGGIAFIGVRLEATGVVVHEGAGSLSIGELDGNESELVQTIVKMFKDAGVPAKLSRDIYKGKWQKLCWNAVFNPLSVIMNGNIGYILDSKDALDVGYQIFSEIRVVAEKKGILIDEGLLDEHIKVTQNLREYHTSMYQDFVKGKPTEIDYFNGYVCREGNKFNVPTPVNCTVTSLVKAILSCRTSHSG
ncbi:MAG: ketopantoate reductase family protein [Nitrospira sp.]|nr:ketopantoate reductase family protein [Nitrospira sp.]